jgi:hypothetical protein
MNHSSDDEPNAELQIVLLEDDDDTPVYTAVAFWKICMLEVTISYMVQAKNESSVELLQQYYGVVPKGNSYDVEMLDECVAGDDNCLEHYLP